MRKCGVCLASFRPRRRSTLAAARLAQPPAPRRCGCALRGGRPFSPRLGTAFPTATICCWICSTGKFTVSSRVRCWMRSCGFSVTTSSVSSVICGTGTSTICSPRRFCCTPSRICGNGSRERFLDNRNTTPENNERVPCEIYNESRPQRDGQVHQAHLQRSPLHKGVNKIDVSVLRDSQGAPPPALLFLRSSHAKIEA